MYCFTVSKVCTAINSLAQTPARPQLPLFKTLRVNNQHVELLQAVAPYLAYNQGSSDGRLIRYQPKNRDLAYFPELFDRFRKAGRCSSLSVPEVV